MKRVFVILALVLSGCATVEDIKHSPATLNVISGKSPEKYADCFVGKIGDSREPPMIERHHDGLRLIVAQKLNSAPAAVVDVEKRSGGSTIKVYERLSNLPVRFRDVQDSAEACISG